MVLDELVGVEHIAADLAAESRRHHLASLARELLLPLLLLELCEPAAEDLHGRVLVRKLGTLVLHADDDPRWQVRNPYGRVGLVDVLAAGPARAVRVDP